MADTLGDILDDMALETRRPRATFGARMLRCVKDAVLMEETNTYWFNDGNTQTFATVASQENYGSAANSIIPYITDFRNLTIAISSTDKRDLVKASWEDLQRMNEDGTSTGQPSHYAYAFKQIRLYPIPTDAWTVTMAISYVLTQLSSDSDTNCWTVEREGGLLIKYMATALFYGTHLREAERAATFQNLAENERSRLLGSTSKRQATGRIRRSL